MDRTKRAACGSPARLLAGGCDLSTPTAPPRASRMTPRTAPDAAGPQRRPTLATAATRLAKTLHQGVARLADDPVRRELDHRFFADVLGHDAGHARTQFVFEVHPRAGGEHSMWSLWTAPHRASRQGSPSRPKYDPKSYLTVRRVHGVRSVNASAASFARSLTFRLSPHVADASVSGATPAATLRHQSTALARPRWGESSPCVRITRNTRVREPRIRSRTCVSSWSIPRAGGGNFQGNTNAVRI